MLRIKQLARRTWLSLIEHISTQHTLFIGAAMVSKKSLNPFLWRKNKPKFKFAFRIWLYMSAFGTVQRVLKCLLGSVQCFAYIVTVGPEAFVRLIV